MSLFSDLSFGEAVARSRQYEVPKRERQLPKQEKEGKKDDEKEEEKKDK